MLVVCFTFTSLLKNVAPQGLLKLWHTCWLFDFKTKLCAFLEFFHLSLPTDELLLLSQKSCDQWKLLDSLVMQQILVLARETWLVGLLLLYLLKITAKLFSFQSWSVFHITSKHRLNIPETIFTSSRFLTNLKMLNKIMTTTIRSLSHQSVAMKSRTSTWCQKNTERCVFQETFMIISMTLCSMIWVNNEICDENLKSGHDKILKTWTGGLWLQTLQQNPVRGFGASHPQRLLQLHDTGMMEEYWCII